MAAKRKLSDTDRLALAISRAIRKSKCTAHEIVNALMAVAAGRAVVGNTHTDCASFEDDAHTAFHGALKVISARHGGGFVN
jgi:hypothetical protein